MSSAHFEKPVWDRGDAIDESMLRFTIGDDPIQDRRLIVHDLRGSIAHARGLARVGLISQADCDSLVSGLERLASAHQRGEWTVEPGDEDVHSAVERRLTEQLGEAGKRLHTARSRNEQVAVDVRLWLRDAMAQTEASLASLVHACRTLAAREGGRALPGYTHLRPAMPSSVGDWILAHARAFEDDALDLKAAARRAEECPLGSGAGYGMPVELAREQVAHELGFTRPVEPVTFVQHARGRAELAYASALESTALDLGKLAADLWLYSSKEFGFVRLPVELTTGSSLMPHKRNPDLIELVRAHSRAVVAERAMLLDVIRDLPSGYHRDFQLIKAPLFQAHDRVASMLPLCAKLIERLEFDDAALKGALSDPGLTATARTLEKVRAGVPFRDAYRQESRSSS